MTPGLHIPTSYFKITRNLNSPQELESLCCGDSQPWLGGHAGSIEYLCAAERRMVSDEAKEVGGEGTRQG